MTNLEMMAETYPLHVQRIAECMCAFDPNGFDEWKDSEPVSNPAWTLSYAFDWNKTSEGYAYWRGLVRGAGDRFWS